jgi:hypothetical protein
VLPSCKDYHLSAIPLVRQPAVYKLWYGGLSVFTSVYIDGVSNRPESLFYARLRACMYSENPCVGRVLGESLGELHGQLRLADATEAHERYTASGCGTSMVDTVKDVPAVDEVTVAGERDNRRRRRRRFRSLRDRNISMGLAGAKRH